MTEIKPEKDDRFVQVEDGDNVSVPAGAPKPDQSGLAPSTRRKASRRVKLMVAGFTLILSWLSAELLLVLAGVSFPLMYQPDMACGTLLRPNLNVRYIEEGRAVVRTNSSGFRERELHTSKPDGVFRIALLGDSFTEAIQVEHEKTWARQLEKLCNQNAENQRVEVLNFGISGFGTAQELAALENYVLPYQPDLIVLLMFTGNDIADNSREIKAGQIKPYYQMKNGKLVLDQSFQEDDRFVAAQSQMTQLKVSLINASRVLQLCNKFYSNWKHRSPEQNVNIGLDTQVYQVPPHESKWSRAWQVTEQVLNRIKNVAGDDGASLVVVTATNPIQVLPDRAKREQYCQKANLKDLDYPDRRIASFGKQEQIPVLNLTPSFRTAADQSGEYFHGFKNTKLGYGHWNALGHEKAAGEIYKFLKETHPKIGPN